MYLVLDTPRHLLVLCRLHLLLTQNVRLTRSCAEVCYKSRGSLCKEYLEWMVDWLMLCSEVVAVRCCGAVVAVLHFTAQTLAWQTSHYSFNHSAADTELLFRSREQRQNIITSSQLN